MTTAIAFAQNKAFSTPTTPVAFPVTPKALVPTPVAQNAKLRTIALAMSADEGSENSETPASPRPLFRIPVNELKNCSHLPTFTLEELEGNITQAIGRTQGTIDTMRQKGEDAANQSVDRLKHSPDPLIAFGQEIAHNITRDLPESSKLLEKSKAQLLQNNYGKAYTSALAGFGIQALTQLGLKKASADSSVAEEVKETSTNTTKTAE